MNPQAKEIWNLCETYVALAKAHLMMMPRLFPPPPDAFDLATEKARVSFLCPDAKASVIDALVTIRRWNQRLLTSVDGCTPEAARQLEQLEAQAEQAKAQIEKHIACFTPVQQEILREKFLGVGRVTD